ncbi:sarcosine oxidase subunit gamma [Trinickia violacea]|uniref:Sarcosine oxidase subunit gamma n=1 Tax=Trinickia violacea TaxID=2571746 RepID=A0A4P8IY45_9BURK|nr:sarcosine oxidase subunit gamma [Trinickia violacea]QCP53346.1 sarcosine oxidase subunit gamma [Trinickia violacea]
MWNEGRGNASAVVERGVRYESPFIGVQDLMQAHQAEASKQFRLNERPFLELVNVRGDLADPAFVGAAESVLGCKPPAKANTVAQGNGCDVLWLGPDEWLVRSLEARAATLETKLRVAFEGAYAAAVDVGSGYTVVEVSGERVRDVLSRGCPLDLHPLMLARGQCAQSHFFKASIVLIPTGNNAFEIVVRRSFADYFCRILLDAAAPLMS